MLGLSSRLGDHHRSIRLGGGYTSTSQRPRNVSSEWCAWCDPRAEFALFAAPGRHQVPVIPLAMHCETRRRTLPEPMGDGRGKLSPIAYQWSSKLETISSCLQTIVNPKWNHENKMLKHKWPCSQNHNKRCQRESPCSGDIYGNRERRSFQWVQLCRRIDTPLRQWRYSMGWSVQLPAYPHQSKRKWNPEWWAPPSNKSPRTHCSKYEPQLHTWPVRTRQS